MLGSCLAKDTTSMAADINLRSGVIVFILFPFLILWLEGEKNNAWYIYLTSRQPPPNLHNLTSADFIINRAVKKVLSSGLLMNSRRLWNSHQRHKFLRAKASRDIWNWESRKWWVQGFSSGIFHCSRHVVLSEYMQVWAQWRQNVPSVPRHRTVRTFHRSEPV